MEKKIDWNEIKKAIPGKPNTWRVDTLGKFLKMCDLSAIVEKFKENAMDGDLFLTISEDDDLWEDLELNSYDEAALKYCQKELRQFNKNFFGNLNEEDNDVIDPNVTHQRSLRNTKLVLLQNNKEKLFKKSFQIHREKERSNEGIFINHKEISRKHAEILYFPKMGFFLRDLQSSNHSYIKIPDSHGLVIYPGLEVVMGKSLFRFEKIDLNKISFLVELNFEDEEENIINLDIEFKSNEVIFGRNPSKKYSSMCILKSDLDKNIDSEHAKFTKYQGKITLTPLNKEVYIKIGNENKLNNSLYLLKKNMELRFSLGEDNALQFKVEEACPSKITKKCSKCNEFIDFIIFPCKHFFCSNCTGQKLNKTCEVCDKKIEEVSKLIDILN